MSIIIPKGYKPLLDQKLTERAIKFVKDTFERELSGELRLSRVTSTLFVRANSGINDDLNGVERPVRFCVGNMNDTQMEIVQRPWLYTGYRTVHRHECHPSGR